MSILKNYGKKIMDRVQIYNRLNILRILEKNKDSKLLDLGCDDGFWTSCLAEKIGTKKIYGVEVVKDKIKKAKLRRIVVKEFDLNGTFDYPDDTFDVVHANQVIEHLYNTDGFISEVKRILRPGGYAIISTVNLASWHNVVALVLGCQPFDSANYSNFGTIGNPFSFWNGKESENSALQSWQHVRVFTYRSLLDLFKHHGFVVERTNGSGYYPLPNFFASLDKFHSHYIVFKIRRPLI
mgnify:FL=1